ncbi:5' exonuclease Apollo-like isoform X2 [Pollicipes pollicipes]|nr:5' exonuclease Apollo-like isoform X2 [Pollicipes pollicipes]XP_037083447.1 5' exonuclease Apollo-like isoform X2 [Pollicipes pollicipes]XP_037083448.1 5' exonuclease Apollo-like isoform X2 [Pollicipes pollicipes]
MNGHIVVPGEIAVDFWKEDAAKYFFLTHCHSDHVSPRLQRWQQKIYTSELNGQIIHMLYHVPEHLLVTLPLGETVGLGVGADAFQVTAMDADHCPGSVVLLFQGRFGTILYTGDFRRGPSLLDEPALRYAITNGGIDQLYLDNTYCSSECVFPPRQAVIQDVIKYLRHFDDRVIYVGIRELGKEDALISIADALNVKVHVSASRLRLLRLFTDSDVFTTQPSEARLHVVPFRNITRYAEPASDGRPTVALLLTALFVGWPGPAPYSGGKVQVFPYGDHSSFPELCELVRQVRPRRVVPVVRRWASRGWFAHRDLSSRSDMTVFRTYLTTEPPALAPAAAGDGPADQQAAAAAAARRLQAGQPAAPAGQAEGAGEQQCQARATPTAPEARRDSPERWPSQPDGPACPGYPMEPGQAEEPAGDQPLPNDPRRWPYTILDGRLVRLRHVLFTPAEVEAWLGGRCAEVSSSCD